MQLRIPQTLSSITIWLLVGYMLSGIIKNALLLFDIQAGFDLTLVLALLITLFGSLMGMRRGFAIKVERLNLMLFVLFALLITWMSISMVYSNSQWYKYAKFFGFCTGVFLVLIPLFFDTLSLSLYSRVYTYLTLFGSWFYIFVMTRYELFEFFFEVKDMYLYFGKMLGTGTILLVFGWRRVLHWSRSKAYLIIFCCILTLLALGARGPFIFFVAVCIVGLFIQLLVGNSERVKPRQSSGQVLTLVLGIVALLGTVMLITFSDDLLQLILRSFNRYVVLFEFLDISSESDGGKSIDNRVQFIQHTFYGIFESGYSFLFGNGFGSFGMDFLGYEAELYPHNLFLEAWYEMGVIGFLLLFGILTLAIWQLTKSPIGFIMIPAVSFELLNFLKSGSFADTRTLFLLITLGLGFSKHQLGLHNETDYEPHKETYERSE